MTASTLILPASGEQDLASWAAVAFVASYSSPGTRQAYTTQLRLRFDWREQHHLEPLADVRRPKLSQESTRLGLDQTELGAFLVQTGLSGGNDHALACLLALNALRVSAACGADLGDLALANGHRVVRIVGKGNQPALMPLAPRTARAIDAAVGERTDGPLLARTDGSRLVTLRSPPRPRTRSSLRRMPQNTTHAGRYSARLEHCWLPVSIPVQPA